MKKNKVVKNILMYLLVIGVFFGSWSVGACIGEPEPIPVGIHESPLDYTYNWGTAGDDEYCLHSTYNTTKGWRHWICGGSQGRTPTDITSRDRIIMYPGTGDDKVVVRWVESPTLGGCGCSCDVNTSVYGQIRDYRKNGGGSAKDIEVWDYDGANQENQCIGTGSDTVWGGLVRSLVVNGDGNDMFRGGPFNDVFQADSCGGDLGGDNYIVDPDGTDIIYTYSGTDTIWDYGGCDATGLENQYQCGPFPGDDFDTYNCDMGDYEWSGCDIKVVPIPANALQPLTCPASPFPSP